MRKWIMSHEILENSMPQVARHSYLSFAGCVLHLITRRFMRESCEFVLYYRDKELSLVIALTLDVKWSIRASIKIKNRILEIEHEQVT